MIRRLTDRLALAGLSVSPCCLGIAGSEDAVEAAFEAGINFFFVTADMHWPVYEATRRGLARLLARPGVRDQVVIAAVAYPTQPEFCRAPFNELLEAVPGLDRIDVLVAGGAYGGEFLQRLPVYRDHRQRGFAGARAIGASFHDRKAAALAIVHRMVDLAWIRYNPAHPGARTEVFPHVQATDNRPLVYNFKSTLGFVPAARRAELGAGEAWWQPTITDHYRFALTRPEIDGILVSVRNPSEIAQLAAALERGPLAPEEEQFLIDLAELDRLHRED